MKSITSFLILFITMLTVSKSNSDDFSINPFIKSLKQEGLFDIINSIKDSYGNDVAIISCEEIKKDHGGNCKTLVTDYMPPSGKIFIPPTKYRYMKRSSFIIKKKSMKEILNKKYSQKKTNKIYDNIKIKMVKKGIYKDFLFQELLFTYKLIKNY
mgnify:CR=1 FL=1